MLEIIKEIMPYIVSVLGALIAIVFGRKILKKDVSFVDAHHLLYSTYVF